MNTTGMGMTVTEELLAELELCESCDCGLDMDRADVRTVMAELRRLRAENAELAKDAGMWRKEIVDNGYVIAYSGCPSVWRVKNEDTFMATQ